MIHIFSTSFIKPFITLLTYIKDDFKRRRMFNYSEIVGIMEHCRKNKVLTFKSGSIEIVFDKEEK